jgi:hypothetical protein
MTNPTILLLLHVFVAAGTCLPSLYLATTGGTQVQHGFMKYAVQMGSGAMIYISCFRKIASSNQKLTGGIHRHTDARTAQ